MQALTRQVLQLSAAVGPRPLAALSCIHRRAAMSSSGPAKPAVTDATVASDDELRSAASFFFPADSLGGLTFERCGGGVNNKVYLAHPVSGDALVIRVYNNGFNRPRVEYEHAVLSAVADAVKGRGRPLSFQIPSLRRAVTDGSSTIVRLPNGADVCCFERIPGAGAPLTAARSIGRATAELVEAMAGVRVALPLPNPLYRNIYDAHHKMTRELFWSVFGQGPAYDAVRPATEYLAEQIRAAEALVARVSGLGLPEQQIHADLHFQNVLAEGDTVTGLLDFEFAAYDWRVMEMVVGLSKYVGLPGCDAHLTAWVEGYAEGGGRLTATERSLVPDLVILRILSNVVYFVGRAAAGEDDIAALTTRADMYADRCRWLHAQRGWIVGLLDSKLA